ncbi:MAG TPA: TonB-dependent receptor [Pelobium sp.]|nr:TonB-dependent receptor [Pelobium sp.]
MKSMHNTCFLWMMLFLFGAISAEAQTLIKGTVKDLNGEALPGVSVTVKGKTGGTVTAPDGSFKINAQLQDVLEIKYLGFETQQVTVTNTSSLNITLKQSTSALDEVVVIGYGTQRKSSLTGAVAKLNNDNLNQIPVSRADQALAGKLAGVQVINTDATAGAAPIIKVRGSASITAGTTPLYVVDGYPIPGDLSTIDMNNVESIEVLKDAASAAIYGSRGANGVVLVTTKSGKSGATKFSFNNSTGTKSVYRKLDFLTLTEWANHVKEVNNGVLSPEIITAQKYDVETDPQDIAFQTGFFQNTQFSLSGGSEKVKFYVSGEGLYDKGVIKTNNYKRYGGQVNLNITPNKKWEIGVNLTPSYAIQRSPTFKTHDVIRSIALWLPLYATQTIADDTGIPLGYIVHQRDFDPSTNTHYTGLNLSATANNTGYTNLTGVSNMTYVTKTLANANVKYNITDDLSVRVSGGVYFSNSKNEFFQKSWATRDPLIQGITSARASTRATLANDQNIDWLSENLLNYNKVIGKSSFNAIAGFTAQSNLSSYSNSAATNFLTDNIPTLNAGTLNAVSSSKQRNNLASALFRVNYSYDDKYLASFASRWDGSSRFGAGNRWGFFPSASLGWRVSQEDFWSPDNFVNDLKVRASYGATGNNNIGNYRAFANVNTVGAILDGSGTTLGFNSDLYDNPQLGWERNFSFNGGVDFGFLKNRFTLSIDAYKSTTKDLLLYLAIPSVTGSTGVWGNTGEVQNQGLEYELTANVINQKNLKWSISTNGSTNKNTVKDLGNSNLLINVGDPKRPNYFLSQVGSPLVQFYGFEYESDIPVSGNFWPINVHSDKAIVKDKNDDGVINDLDRVVLGQPTPKFIWGLTNTFQIKNFDVSFVIQGSHGASVFNADPNYYETQFAATGTNAYLNLPVEQRARVKYKTETSYAIEDASFVALRNLNVGYKIPAKFLGKSNSNYLRVYASAYNLWYKFADNYSSYNPEGVNEYTDDPLRNGYQRGAAPITRNITFGINANF